MPTATRDITRIQDCNDYADALVWASLQTFNAGAAIASGQGITMADDTWIGIGAALERIEFDEAGDVKVVGANLQLPADDQLLEFGATQQYSIQHDGDDAVHTISTGSFLFTGGNVAIGGGTVSPDAKLHIYPVSGNANLQLTGADGAYATQIFQVYSDTNWHSPTLSAYRSRGIAASKDAVVGGDTLLTYSIFGHDGNTFERRAQFNCMVDGAVSDGVVPMRWEWRTSDDGTDASTGSQKRLVIKSSGRIGINEAVPNSTLDVNGTTRLGDSDTNYAAFAADGELTLAGTARVKKTIDLAGATFEIGATAPAAVVVGTYLAWEYDIGDDSVLTFELPHDWATGTDLTIKVDWGVNRAEATENADVQWNVAWSACPHDASESLAAPTHSGALDPGDISIPTTANHLTRTTMGNISGASLSAEDEIGLQISRVAVAGNDPGAGVDPYITHLYIEYIADKLGEAT